MGTVIIIAVLIVARLAVGYVKYQFKNGDIFLREQAWKRHEADKLERLANFKALMANADKVDICATCGADTGQEFRQTRLPHMCRRDNVY
jgi:hypothetical protein